MRLIQRTTRSLRLTDTGNAYYAQCARILAEIEEANIAVTQMQSTPTGTLCALPRPYFLAQPYWQV